MYELNDTIVAVSSPTSEQRVIVRITGQETIDTLQRIFRPRIPKDKAGIVTGSITIYPDLQIDAVLYLFAQPNSYTGENLAEIHIQTNSSVTRALMDKLLSIGIRMAGPGEFTARAYLNGKMDLAQAEAVNEIITSSNKFQLAAAEKLLAGQLAQTTEQIQTELLDMLSLIETGLDFSGEDIEFITAEKAVERLTKIKEQLEQLLAASFSYESVIDLPAVGIAGASNAGKSSLANKLLGTDRSIVSAQRKTTRDVLTGLLTLKHNRAVLFDCAGLDARPSLRTRRSRAWQSQLCHCEAVAISTSRLLRFARNDNSILDKLAQQAAIEALRKASVVVFCVDISKTDLSEDIAIRELMKTDTGEQGPIAVATKSDLLSTEQLAKRLAELRELFNTDFLTTSVKTNTGIKLLADTIDKKIIELTSGGAEQNTGYQIPDMKHQIALTARHRQAVTGAIENIAESMTELKAGNDEVAAMMMRSSYQQISTISTGRLTAEQQTIDEQVLENIFSRFCIGK